LGERPAAPRESATPPFDKLVFGSFLMFPGPGFRAAKAAIWAAASNRWRLLARIDILALPFANAKSDRRLLGQWNGALTSYFLPKLYTVCAGTRKSRGLMARKLAASP
jgi:hypothetical protein